MKLFCWLCFAIFLAICSDALARPDPVSKDKAKKLKGEKALTRNKFGKAKFPEELDVSETDPSGKESTLKLNKVVNPKVELLLRKVNKDKEIATYVSGEASLACVLDSETNECHLMGWRVDAQEACMVVDGVETCEPRTTSGTTFDVVLGENGEPLTDEAIVEQREEREARDTRGRKRRDVTGHHHIEVCLAMDYEYYRKTINVQPISSSLTEYEFAELMTILIMNSVNQVYSVIHDRGFTLEVVLAGLHIATTETEPSWSSVNRQGHADARKMWRNVEDFMESVFDPSYCDGYMAVTGHDLYSGRQDILGIAYLASLCSPLNNKRYVSPVSFTEFGFETFYTLAHELGHAAGAYHDPLSGDCSVPATVMAASAEWPEPGWYNWSSCAKDDFEYFLSLDRSSCLDDDNFNMDLHLGALCEGFVGEYLDANQQCLWNTDSPGFWPGYEPETLGETLCETFSFCASGEHLLVDDYTPCGVGGADKVLFCS